MSFQQQSSCGQRSLNKASTEYFKPVLISGLYKGGWFDGDLCMRAEARDVTGPGPLAGGQASAAEALDD